MSLTRLVPLLLPLLLPLAALLPAQQYHGEPPPLVRPLAPDARFDPARYNAGQLQCLSIVPERRGSVVDDYITFSHSVNAAPPRIGAARRNRGTDAIQVLTDFDAITRPGDDWIRLADPTVGVMDNAGVHSLVLRLTGSGSWNQRRVIPNLPTGFRKPALYVSEGVLRLMGCTPTTVWDYEVDPTTAIVSNGRSFTPTLGGTGSTLECVVPIVDPEWSGGDWHGVFLLVNQAGDSGQIVYHNPAHAGFLGDQAFREVRQGPQAFTSITQYRGGTFVGTIREVLIPARIDTLLIGDRKVPSGGGFVLLSGGLPERQPNAQEVFVVMAIGIQAQGPIPIPGFANPLGLGVLILIGAAQVPNLVDTQQFGVMFPPLPPGARLTPQAALLSLVALNHFSNNSEVFE